MDEIKNTGSKPDPDDKDKCDTTCAKGESNAVLNAGASRLKNNPSEPGQGLKVDQGIMDVEKQSDAILIKDDFIKNVTRPGRDNKVSLHAINIKNQSESALNVHYSKTLEGKPIQNDTTVDSDIRYCVKKQSNTGLSSDDAKKSVSKSDDNNKEGSDTTNVKIQFDLIPNTKSKHRKGDKVDSDKINMKNQSDVVLFKTLIKDDKCNTKCQPHGVLKAGNAIVKSAESESAQGHQVDQDATDITKQSDVIMNADKSRTTENKPDLDNKLESAIIKDIENSEENRKTEEKDGAEIEVKSKDNDEVQNEGKDGEKVEITSNSKNEETLELKKEEKDETKIDMKSKEKDHEQVEVKNEKRDGNKIETKSERKDGDKENVKSKEKSEEKVESKTVQNLDTPDVKKLILDDIYKDEKISTDFETKKLRKRKGFKCLKIFSEIFKKSKKADEEEYGRTYKKEEKKYSLFLSASVDDEKRLKETNNIVGKEENEWFIQQYEKYIGNKKVIQINPDILIKDLKMKAMTRFIPESMFYRPKQPRKPKDSLFLSWKGPVVPKCGCPYRECFCRGDTKVLEEKSNSYFSKVVKREFKLKQRRWNFEKPGVHSQSNYTGKPYVKTLFKRVQERLALEENYYKELEILNKLHKLNPEFCLEKCYHCDHRDERNLRTTQFLPLFMYEEQEEESDEDGGEMEEPEAEPEEEPEEEPEPEPEPAAEDERICNIYNNTCTVSIQTDPIGPDGNFILPIGLENNFLLPSIQNSIFSNIEGSKIEINPYEEHKEDELDDRMDVCAQKIEGFSFKDIKSRFSKLLSSILEIKASGVPINTRYTQLPCRGVICDDGDECFAGYSLRHTGSRDYICGAVDYDFLPEIPYTEHLSVSDVRKAYEQRNNDPCPCCNMYDRNRSRLAYEECIAKKHLIITPKKNVCEKLPDLTQKASDIDMELQASNSNKSQNVQDALLEEDKSKDSDVEIKYKENDSKPSTSKNEAKDSSYEINNKVNFNVPNTMSETEPQKDLDVNNSISSITKVKPQPTPKSSPRTLEEKCDLLNTTKLINQLSGSKYSVKLSNMQLKSGSDMKKIPLNIIAEDKISQSTFTIPSDTSNVTILAKNMSSGDALNKISPCLSNNAIDKSNSNTPSVLSSIFNWIFNPKASLFNKAKSLTNDLKISSKDRKTSLKDLKIISKENTVEGEKLANKASDVSEKEVFSLQYSTTQSVSRGSSTAKVQSHNMS